VRLVCGSATYAPQGGLASVVLGQAGGFTGVNLSHTYNSRLQPSRMQASSTGGNALDMTYGFNLGAGDNGNVVSVTNNLDGTRSQNFTYDQLNRLKTAQTQSTTGGNCWGLSFTYDTWANLTAAAVTQCTAPMLSITVDTKNRVTTGGFSYDLAGNVTADGSFNYAWNAESEMKTAAGVTYTYDGLGNRVKKSNGKLYWYGMGSAVLDESDLSGNVTSEYVYFGGQRVARRDASGNVYYYVEDMLGTSRVLTTSNGTVCYDADFYPFGGERTPVVNTCPQNFKFNGKERDPETGLDDFGARYFSSSFGRWLSPDWSAIPAPVPYANLTNPQTLNLYQFVGDNPETFADLDGHEGWMYMIGQTGGFGPDLLSGTGFFDNGVALTMDPVLSAIPSQDRPTQQQPDVEKPKQEQKQQQSQAQQNANTPAPTNPDGTPKPPPVPPPPGKDGKPNEWVRTPGKDGKPDSWDPKDTVPSPKGGQPRARWDERQGHWDIDDGNKNRDRYLPDGTKVDHNNRPIPKSWTERLKDFNREANKWMQKLPPWFWAFPL
jgi:RHS repeat-associated protein